MRFCPRVVPIGLLVTICVLFGFTTSAIALMPTVVTFPTYRAAGSGDGGGGGGDVCKSGLSGVAGTSSGSLDSVQLNVSNPQTSTATGSTVTVNLPTQASPSQVTANVADGNLAAGANTNVTISLAGVSLNAPITESDRWSASATGNFISGSLTGDTGPQAFVIAPSTSSVAGTEGVGVAAAPPCTIEDFYALGAVQACIVPFKNAALTFGIHTTVTGVAELVADFMKGGQKPKCADPPGPGLNPTPQNPTTSAASLSLAPSEDVGVAKKGKKKKKRRSIFKAVRKKVNVAGQEVKLKTRPTKYGLRQITKRLRKRKRVSVLFTVKFNGSEAQQVITFKRKKKSSGRSKKN